MNNLVTQELHSIKRTFLNKQTFHKEKLNGKSMENHTQIGYDFVHFKHETKLNKQMGNLELKFALYLNHKTERFFWNF